MKTRILLMLGVLALSPAARAAQENAPGNMNKKELEAKAKALVSEAKALEKEGRLPEALDKFIDAEGYVSSKDALNGIKHVRELHEKQVEAYIADARGSFQATKYGDCAKKLEQALELAPSSAVAHYDLALCYEKLEERTKAVVHFDHAVTGLTNKKERNDLLELRSRVFLGVDLSDPPSEARERLMAFNAALLQVERDPGDSKAAKEKKSEWNPRSVCEAATGLDHEASVNSAVVFDMAKCADEDARQAEAAKFLAQYVKLAPNALDVDDMQLRQDALASLAALDGDKGTAVRRHYATAARYIDYRRYDRAIGEYQAALEVSPDYAQTEWRLGILYDAYGDVSKARQHFERFRQLETSEHKNMAEAHLETLAARREEYDADVDEAHDLLADLLLRSMGLDVGGRKHKSKMKGKQQKASKRYQTMMAASETLSSAYVRRQIARAQADLTAAVEVFPLGLEANEMLALINLENNDWASAYRSFDAVASQGMPVSFYAQVSTQHKGKVVRAAKVEIGKEQVRIVYLSSYNAKKQISEPPENPAGEDDLGNLVASPSLPPDAQAECMTLTADEIKGIETNKNFVVLKLRKDEVYIAPVYMVTFTPFEGPEARTFGNEYTRLFVRYLGYENAKLGKEGMTFGEKFKLAMEIANMGMDIFSSVGNPINSYAAFQDTMNLIKKIQVDTRMLQQTFADQRRALVGLEFKIIPCQAVKLNYREKM